MLVERSYRVPRHATIVAPKLATSVRSQIGMASVDISRSLDFQGAHQPWNNYLLKDCRIRPYLYLPAKVAAMRIDPGVLWNIPAVQQKVNIRNWNLCIQDPG